jgi:hypothetical protein
MMKTAHVCQSNRAQLEKSASVVFTAVQGGRVDCLVCWMEYELSSGITSAVGGGHSLLSSPVVLSYAPSRALSSHQIGTGVCEYPADPYHENQQEDSRLSEAAAYMETADPPRNPVAAISPHFWQHVHYMSLKPQVMRKTSIIS